MSTEAPATVNCTKCQDLGWIPSKGYRFYSDNGRLCPCGAFRTELTTPGQDFFGDLRRWVAAVQQAEIDAERKAARDARRAARSAQEETTR